MCVCLYCATFTLFFLCSFGTDYVSTKWDDFSCADSNYLSVAQCTYSTSIDSDCNSDSTDATVTCCKFITYCNILQVHTCILVTRILLLVLVLIKA